MKSPNAKPEHRGASNRRAAADCAPQKIPGLRPRTFDDRLRPTDSEEKCRRITYASMVSIFSTWISMDCEFNSPVTVTNLPAKGRIPC